MIGVILVSISAFFQEIFATIGKKEVEKHEESIYAMGFFLFFWSTLTFLIIILIKGEFGFSLASLPTFLARFVVEIILMLVALKALVEAERSTFSFIRTGTLPLLLVVDIYLGYSISLGQMLGIALIVFTLLIIFMNHGIKRKGLELVVISTFLPVITISLFKYNITYYNSVEAEQFVMQALLLSYFFFTARSLGHENPFKMLRKPVFLKQSLAEGVGSVLASFAYIYAPASVITSAKRSAAVFWSILSGNKIFHEKHIVLKMIMFVMLMVGIILLVM